MTYYSVKDGKILSKTKGHKSVISSVYTDLKNKLLVSAGWDGRILVQRTQEKKSLLRILKNTHFDKPIGIMRVSVDTNTIATVADDYVLIWSYDTLSLLGICDNSKNEILSLEFFEYRPLLVSIDKANTIKIWNLSCRDLFTYFKPLIIFEADITVGDKLSKSTL